LVTRLSLPNNDWSLTENHDIYSFCKRFFTEYQFDLIHMHSMQVLTCSVGVAANDLNIPYIVTLHDAWWLSRYMFLIDEFGNAVDPANPLSGGSAKGQDEIKTLLARDKTLRNVLKNAKMRLAVSQKFADLYMSAGVVDVQVHENIVEPFEVYERQPEPDGKIVLGFIGGMSKHKGYNLFRQALEEGEFENFKALVVDSSLYPGETYEVIWGKTKVKFIPKIKQDEIGKLYAQMDVLIAPSIWPESFGLVTREALMAGVWVISSMRGAIGDAVNNGQNGELMSDCTPCNLKNIISGINKIKFNPNFIPDEHSFHSYCKQLVQFYEQCYEK
jgi:glycosyltransferase involved in cell wall biosynthesis